MKTNDNKNIADLYVKSFLKEDTTSSSDLIVQYAKEALDIINEYVQKRAISKLMREFKLVSKLTQIESIVDNFKNTAAGRLLIYLRTGGDTTLFKSDLESLLVEAITELNSIISKQKRYKAKTI